MPMGMKLRSDIPPFGAICLPIWFTCGMFLTTARMSGELFHS